MVTTVNIDYIIIISNLAKRVKREKMYIYIYADTGPRPWTVNAQFDLKTDLFHNLFEFFYPELSIAPFQNSNLRKGN